MPEQHTFLKKTPLNSNLICIWIETGDMKQESDDLSLRVGHVVLRVPNQITLWQLFVGATVKPRTTSPAVDSFLQWLQLKTPG